MNCPHCRSHAIALHQRVLSSAANPVVCPRCKGQSLPGRSRWFQVGILAINLPLLALLLGGTKHMGFFTWMGALVWLVPLTWAVVVVVQWRAQLVVVSLAELENGRSRDRLITYGFLFLVAVWWVV
jgi:hypothetical protein